MKNFVRKHFLSEDSSFVKFWNQHSGDWHWLEDKQRSIASINRHLWRLSVPSLSFHFLLALSGVIATFGLLANSVAVIIGAMIVAPLMGPIIGIAYAMVAANRRLLRRSLLTLLTGTVLTVSISLATAYLVGLKTLSPEVLARANPTSIDLGVALAAGAAGAFANSRRHIADALPGVAIAVALVPPLSVVGIGLALGENRVAMGALLLFVTNLAGIVFSGGVVFLFQRYGTLARAKRGLLVSVALLSILGLPLGFSLRNLLVKENVRRSVGELIRRRTVTFSSTDVRAVRVSPQPEGGGLRVELEVAAPLGSISDHQVHLVRDFLARELKQEIALHVRVIPVDLLEAPAVPQ